MASPLRLRRNLTLAAFASFLVGASSVHCGSSGNTFTGSNGTGGNGAGSGTSAGGSSGTSTASNNGGSGGNFTLDVQTMDYSAEDFFNTDPPPMTCDGGGMAPPVPGGTPECPSDKNLPGCPCPQKDATAACWTGLRKNRDHGDCMDGMTVCKLSGESDLTWGPCTGEVLPVQGASGKAACTCFSGGHWELANLSPCFVTDSNNMTTTAISTTLNGNQIQCPATFATAPTDPWTTDTLTTDCTGTFKLCYTLKAGDGAHPMPTDCSIIQVCTEAYYSMANAVQTFPPLAGWLSDPSAGACVQSFVDNGGYGEMSVQGQSDECEQVDKVFQHVTYCPLICNGETDAGLPPICGSCMAGGGGNFKKK